MKRYRFRLDSVLRLRRAEEEAARERLMAANLWLRRVIAERDAEAVRYRDLCAAVSATTVADFCAEIQAAELAAAGLAEAGRVVATAADAAALAQVSWNNASRELKIIERLDERRRAEHLDLERLAEIAVIDELNTASFISSSNDLEGVS